MLIPSSLVQRRTRASQDEGGSEQLAEPYLTCAVRPVVAANGVRSVRLQTVIALAFMCILALSGSGIVWLNHRATVDLLHHQVDHQFDVLAQGVTAHVAMQLGSAETVLDTLAANPPALGNLDAAAIILTHVLADLRRASPAVTGLAMATRDGRSVEIERVAPTGDDPFTYELRIGHQDAGHAVEDVLRLGRDFEVLSRASTAPSRDPRTAAWYVMATLEVPQAPSPRMASHRDQDGLTLSRRTKADPGEALSVTIQLAGLSATLRQAQVFEGEHIALFDADGTLLGDSAGLTLTGPIGAMSTQALAEGAEVRRAWTLDEAALAAFRRAPHAQSVTLQGIEGAAYASISPFDVNGASLIVSSSVPTQLFQAPARGLLVGSLLIQAATVAAAGLMVAVASRTISRPINGLASDVERIIAFDFPQRPAGASRIREIQRLLTAVDMLELTLRAFSTYVPPGFVRDLMRRGRAPSLGGARTPVIVMFSDIEGFTGIAEAMQPDNLMLQLSRYFSAISAEVLASGGTVDKFIGDGVMAFWPTPPSEAGRTAEVCEAVLRAAARVDALNEAWTAEGYPTFATRFGLHAGDALVGSIGTADRMNYTVLGHVVNVAARIEELNKTYGTRILVSASLRVDAGGGIGFRHVDAVTMRGTRERIDVYELSPTPG